MPSAFLGLLRPLLFYCELIYSFYVDLSSSIMSSSNSPLAHVEYAALENSNGGAVLLNNGDPTAMQYIGWDLYMLFGVLKAHPSRLSAFLCSVLVPPPATTYVPCFSVGPIRNLLHPFQHTWFPCWDQRKYLLPSLWPSGFQATD